MATTPLFWGRNLVPQASICVYISTTRRPQGDCSPGFVEGVGGRLCEGFLERLRCDCAVRRAWTLHYFVQPVLIPERVKERHLRCAEVPFLDSFCGLSVGCVHVYIFKDSVWCTDSNQPGVNARLWTFSSLINVCKDRDRLCVCTSCMGFSSVREAMQSRLVGGSCVCMHVESGRTWRSSSTVLFDQTLDL